MFQPPCELLQFDLQNGAQYTVGYTQTRGPGKLTVIGLQSSPDLLLALHQHFEVSIPSRSHTGGVTTGLFQRNNEIYLMAANVGAEDKGAHIEFDSAILPNGTWKVENLEREQVTNVEISAVPFLDIQLLRKDGLVMRLSRA